MYGADVEESELSPAGIVKAIAKSLGKEPKIVRYDPKQFTKGFPFRCCPAGHPSTLYLAACIT